MAENMKRFFRKVSTFFLTSIEQDKKTFRTNKNGLLRILESLFLALQAKEIFIGWGPWVEVSINPLVLIDPMKNVVCTLYSFGNNLVIQQQQTKYLKKIWRLVSDPHSPSNISLKMLQVQGYYHNSQEVLGSTSTNGLIIQSSLAHVKHSLKLLKKIL